MQREKINNEIFKQVGGFSNITLIIFMTTIINPKYNNRLNMLHFKIKHRYGNSVPKPYLSRINPVLISCQIQTKNIKHIWSNNLIKIKKPNNKNKWHNKKE